MARGTRSLRLHVALVCAALSVAASAQTIGAATSLSFGSFIAGSGGTVTVTPIGGRATTGGVLTVGQGAGVAAAQFTVLGTANATYSITVPADDIVLLNDGNGHSMALNSFVSSPTATGTLSGGGNQVIRIGATLIVGNNQMPGNYAGAFNVTVNY
jgi:hypothetical protein